VPALCLDDGVGYNRYCSARIARAAASGIANGAWAFEVTPTPLQVATLTERRDPDFAGLKAQRRRVEWISLQRLALASESGPPAAFIGRQCSELGSEGRLLSVWQQGQVYIRRRRIAGRDEPAGWHANRVSPCLALGFDAMKRDPQWFRSINARPSPTVLAWASAVATATPMADCIIAADVEIDSDRARLNECRQSEIVDLSRAPLYHGETPRAKSASSLAPRSTGKAGRRAHRSCAMSRSWR